MNTAFPREVVGTRAAAATGHPAASRAAMRTFSSGGSVVDAAIAASAVLAVAMPHATSIGGDAFVLVRDGDTGVCYGLNASGTSPGSATSTKFIDGMQQRGPTAPVVPGLVRGWESLHSRFGTLMWKSLFDDAIDAAESGCLVTTTLSRSIQSAQERLRADPGCAGAFLPFGAPLDQGSALMQPALGKTLRSIATFGAGALYEGDAGAEMIRYIRHAGGLMSVEDLREFSVNWVEPLKRLYQGHEIAVMPPNSCGVLMLMQLQALATIPERALKGESAARMHWQIRAMRACFATGLDEIGDPSSMTTTPDGLLCERTLAEISLQMQAGLSKPARETRGGTSCVTIADINGNAACIVQSIYNPFGACFLDPHTGIILNNRMFGFDAVPGRVNSIAPRKRSVHTLNPVIATKDGNLRWVYASPGGISQTITGTQMLVNLVDRQQSPAEAVRDPRWAIDRIGNTLVEPSVAPEVLNELSSAGIEARYETDTYLFGSVNLVQYDSDRTVSAVGDIRRESCALAI